MRRLGLVLVFSIVAGCAAPAAEPRKSTTPSMRAFTSDKELLAFMRRLSARQRTVQHSPPGLAYEMAVPAPPPAVPSPAVVAPQAAPVPSESPGC